MKIRSAYVSNSSSSSFILAGVPYSKEDFTDGEDIDKDERTSELMDKFLEKSLDLEFDFAIDKELESRLYPLEVCFSQEDSCLYIGIPISKMEDWETKKDFLQRAKNELESIGFCGEKKIMFYSGSYRI